MRTIIAGSRNIFDYDLLLDAIENCGWEITEVVSGTAQGVDRLGEHWANENNIKLRRFPANWNKHGRSAGPIRNKEMANYSEALIALWDGNSCGTEHMIKEAKKCGLKIIVKRTDQYGIYI